MSKNVNEFLHRSADGAPTDAGNRMNRQKSRKQALWRLFMNKKETRQDRPILADRQEKL